MPAGPLDEQLERARHLGFLGPGPVDAHRLHAESLAETLEAQGLAEPDLVALDLGSGGGVPGLVLAMRWPASRWTLLDANERRTSFLADAVASLGLGARVVVIRERAELAGREDRLREQFTLVTARSFGPPAVTAECGAPFLVDGGMLAVSEPPDPDPRRWPPAGLARVGLSPAGPLREPLGHDRSAGSNRLSGSAGGTWAVFRRSGPLPEELPRRVGQPAKRPLWS